MRNQSGEPLSVERRDHSTWRRPGRMFSFFFYARVNFIELEGVLLVKAG